MKNEKIELTLTKFSATVPSTLTKSIRLDKGELKKQSKGYYSEGRAEQIKVSSLSEFQTMRQELKLNEALGFAVANEGNDVAIVTDEKLKGMSNRVGTTARTKSEFSWPDGGGMLMLDYDPPKGGTSINREQFVNAILSAAPALKDIPMLWTTSAGSCIYNSETDEQLIGITGQRLYIPIKDASDIPVAGDKLHELLWLGGHGRYDISAAGSLLDRSPIDTAVWETNRLDYAAGASCTPPLVQRSQYKIIGGDGAAPLVLFDSFNDIRQLTNDEVKTVEALRLKARRAVAEEANTIKQERLEHRAKELAVDSSPKAIDAARAMLSRAQDNHILNADFPLEVKNPNGGDIELVTVGDVLDSGTKYHGWQTRDPLEPDYENHKIVGKLYLIGVNQNLNSMAHGGRNFKLRRQPISIKVVQGRDKDTTDRVLEVLRAQPDWFDRGGELVMVGGNGLVRMTSRNQDAAAHHLGGIIQFYRGKHMADGSYKESLCNPPVAVVRAIIQLGEERSLNKLRAVINAPTITPQGSLVAQLGYHEESQLYLSLPIGDMAAPVSFNPTQAEVLDALDILYEPFSQFKMDSEQDRGILLAAILTAITRPALRTAPAFGFEAPVQGSGKTLMAECISVLATGATPSTLPPVGDEEMRKVLHTLATEDKRVAFFDNWSGVLKGEALSAAATSEWIAGRILGKSESSSAPNLLLLLVTGNNMSVDADMARRILMARINTGVAEPYNRKFSFCPRTWVKEERQELVACGLTVIRGYLSSGVKAVKGNTASYEDWDTIVRQTVVWVSETLYGGKQYGDPLRSIEALVAAAEDAGDVVMLVGELREIYKDKPFTCAEVLSFMDNMGGFSLKYMMSDFEGDYDLNAIKIGRLFGKIRDRIAEGYALRPAGQKKGIKRWQVVKMVR